jgi:hypothetical protein
MAELPRYRRDGLLSAVSPGFEGVGLSEAARASETLTRAMDRVSQMAFQVAGEQAKIEGIEYGAANAPTVEQINKAKASGKNIEELLPGDTFSIFGQAARGTAIDLITANMEYEARRSITAVQAGFEAGTVSLSDMQTQLATIEDSYSAVISDISPAASAKFRAKIATIGNSAFLSAAKDQVKRDKIDQEIILRDLADQAINDVPDIYAAGPSVNDQTGETVTPDQKIDLVIDDILRSAQYLDDVEFGQSKINDIRAAASQAKINVVMEEVRENPSAAMQVYFGKSKFTDAVVQYTFDNLSLDERGKLFAEIDSHLAAEDRRENAEEARNKENRARQSSELQAQITEHVLDGDRESANAVLDKLRNVDPEAWEKKSETLATQPGRDLPSAVIRLRRLSANRQLTLEDIDAEYSAGNLGLPTYKEFVTDLKSQSNQKYNRAIDWLKSNRGFPEGTLINFNVVQQAADREVASVKGALIEALEFDPGLDPLQFVKDEVVRLEKEQGNAANAALRSKAYQLAEELRSQMPGASAQELLNRLNEDASFYPNPQLRGQAIDTLIPLLIELESQQQ